MVEMNILQRLFSVFTGEPSTDPSPTVAIPADYDTLTGGETIHLKTQLEYTLSTTGMDITSDETEFAFAIVRHPQQSPETMADALQPSTTDYTKTSSSPTVRYHTATYDANEPYQLFKFILDWTWCETQDAFLDVDADVDSDDGDTTLTLSLGHSVATLNQPATIEEHIPTDREPSFEVGHRINVEDHTYAYLYINGDLHDVTELPSLEVSAEWTYSREDSQFVRTR